MPGFLAFPIHFSQTSPKQTLFFNYSHPTQNGLYLCQRSLSPPLLPRRINRSLTKRFTLLPEFVGIRFTSIKPFSNRHLRVTPLVLRFYIFLNGYQPCPDKTYPLERSYRRHQSARVWFRIILVSLWFQWAFTRQDHSRTTSTEDPLVSTERSNPDSQAWNQLGDLTALVLRQTVKQIYISMFC